RLHRDDPAREQGDQEIAEMRDRGVGENALDVALEQSQEVPGEYGCNGDDVDHHQSRRECVGVGGEVVAKEEGEHVPFETTAMKPVTGAGAPSYTSGAHR